MTPTQRSYDRESGSSRSRMEDWKKEGKQLTEKISSKIGDRFGGKLNRESLDSAMENFNAGIEKATDFVRQRPLATFGAAVGIGFLVGSIILRAKHRSDFDYDARSDR